MKELEPADIWKYYDKDNWIVITTNGSVRNDGLAVMGKGIAEQAAKRLPFLQLRLGQAIKEKGNKVFAFSKFRVITFPVKHHWMQKADLRLVEKSAYSLAEWASNNRDIDSIYIVRPGCGNGRLSWEEVKPILEPILDDTFKVVNYA